MITLLIFVNTVALYFLLAIALSWIGRVFFPLDLSYQKEKEGEESQDHSQSRSQSLRVELILANSGEQIEYVMRSLIFHSKTRGIPIKVTLRDQGSQDETLSILRFFRRDYPGLIGEGQEPADRKVEL